MRCKFKVLYLLNKLLLPFTIGVFNKFFLISKDAGKIPKYITYYKSIINFIKQLGICLIEVTTLCAQTDFPKMNNNNEK